MLHLVMPLKELRMAKSRLSELLDPQQREAFVAAMALDQIEILLSHRKVSALTVIAGPGWGPDLSKQSLNYVEDRLQVLSEDSLGASGLNSLLRSALDVLQPTLGLVLHGDLPLLHATDIDAVCSELDQHAFVLCPDAAHRGTNGLAFRSTSKPVFEFGENSFAKHRQQAMDSTESYGVLKSPGFALDIDSPTDLLELIRAFEAGATMGPRLSEWLSDNTLELKLAAQKIKAQTNKPESRSRVAQSLVSRRVSA